MFEHDTRVLFDLYAEDGSIDLGGTSCKATRLRCRVLFRTEIEMVLYSRRHSFMPTEILSVAVAEANRRHRSLMLTGQVHRARVDIAGLRLSPLEFSVHGQIDIRSLCW